MISVFLFILLVVDGCYIINQIKTSENNFKLFYTFTVYPKICKFRNSILIKHK